MNVYGSEVTEATVKRQPGYLEGTPVTKLDMAKLAMTMINDENKRDKARACLNDLADNYDDVNGVATKGLIYNATGETMEYVTKHDYDGHFKDSMPPLEIHNGQWGVFFHQKNSSPVVPGGSSEGAVVYRLQAVDCMMSWLTRSAGAGPNQCYAEIRGKDHFDDTSVWQWYSAGGNQWTETANSRQISSVIGHTSVCEYFAVVNLLH